MRSDDKVWLDSFDARLLERLHGDLPLVDRPFAQVADELGCSEDEVIERLASLLAHGVLTRFGPLFQIERAGGSFVLAAMAVPERRFDAVARTVNALARGGAQLPARVGVAARRRALPRAARRAGAHRRPKTYRS